MEELYPDTYSEQAGQQAIRWLRKYRTALASHRESLSYQRDALVDSLKVASGGDDAYLRLKRALHNDQLADLVLNRTELHKIVKKEGLLLRKMDPIHMQPLRNNGRAHFYSSVKILGKHHLSTSTFNLLVIWATSLILYFLLRYSVLKKILELFTKKRNG
jgi:hypothetical protein